MDVAGGDVNDDEVNDVAKEMTVDVPELSGTVEVSITVCGLDVRTGFSVRVENEGLTMVVMMGDTPEVVKLEAAAEIANRPPPVYVHSC